MSTKVYTAWRVRQRGLARVLRRYQEIMRPLVQKQLMALSTCVKNPTDKGKYLSPMEFNHALWALVRETQAEVVKTGQRVPTDATAYVGIWLVGGWAYIRPFEAWNAYKFDTTLAPRNIRVPTYEEYGYWNNSDRPRRVTVKEWDERGDLWHYIDDHRDKVVCLVNHFFEAQFDAYQQVFGTHSWPDTTLPIGHPKRYAGSPRPLRKFFAEIAEKFIEYQKTLGKDESEPAVQMGVDG